MAGGDTHQENGQCRLKNGRPDRRPAAMGKGGEPERTIRHDRKFYRHCTSLLLFVQRFLTRSDLVAGNAAVKPFPEVLQGPTL